MSRGIDHFDLRGSWPPKQGVKKWRRKKILREPVKNPFQTISHWKKKFPLKRVFDLPPTMMHLPMRNWTGVISVQSDSRWSPHSHFCVQYYLPHNYKTIALSQFVLITKIIVHGNMHRVNYTDIWPWPSRTNRQFHHKMANLTFKLCFKVKEAKITTHGNTHPVNYWSLPLTSTLKVKSSISSKNGKFDL